ncbi:hypothetical protein O6H91_11G063300 [Diphasiastrum complanatum]|uniref:Uncharacterized protein n=1 Tax=Diphasiastrum complanatum TaxID=34168 RepID=A0ACC2C9S8_DIPCM|nr:hypothetical protein O6H91_11G063300 [Diphasiastrum complanatum]
MMPSCFQFDAGTGPDFSNPPFTCQLHAPKKQLGENVTRLLGRREVSPSIKRPLRRLWGESVAWSESCSGHRCETVDVKHALIRWVEAESFKHAVAKYCPLLPAPRSTIAAAFSPDGKILASTHGDHTVKIICCRSGDCLKVLSGHRRTPWVVRFHPKISELLASGSLDYEVRLWDANTAECVGSRDFNRPIASLAFHAQGDLLAVASGHKLYIWQYKGEGEASTPNIVLRTRRSLRAVHFHPHAAPLLLTAEVNDLDSPDCPMTPATSRGYQQHHFPVVSLNYPTAFRSQDLNNFAAMPQQSVSVPGWFWMGEGQGYPNLLFLQPEASVSQLAFEPSALQLPEGFEATLQDTNLSVHPPESTAVAPMDISPRASNVNGSLHNAQRRASTSGSYEHLQRIGQGSLSEVGADFVSRFAGESESLANSGRTNSNVVGADGIEPSQTQSEQQQFFTPSSVPRSDGPPTQTRSTEVVPVGSGIPTEAEISLVNGGETHRGLGGRLHLPSLGLAEEAAAQAAITAAELPCTVKLRLWPHDIKRPCALLDPETCRLTIPHAVLCSEMGTHFSPCGRFLAACVACVLPSPDLEACPQARFATAGIAGTGFSVQSPTRHPISAQQIIYELRIYSLEEITFGEVLSSRAVRAAHCLTSIQVCGYIGLTHLFGSC